MIPAVVRELAESMTNQPVAAEAIKKMRVTMARPGAIKDLISIFFFKKKRKKKRQS